LKADKVLIPGKFEVIHAGHIRLFRTGKQLAKKTIVALDINGLAEEEVAWRIGALNGLKIIDQIETYDLNVLEIISILKPDLVLKGQEFAYSHNLESDYIESYGGKLIFSSGSAFYSEGDFTKSSNSNASIDIYESGQEFLSRNNIDKKGFKKTISNFQNLRTCVIGDLIIDEIINCHPVGMSQEEPSIVVTQIDSQKFIGGAGIVAAHCSALGSRTTFVTVLGDDSGADWGKNELSKLGLKLTVFQDNNRVTNLKQRFKSGKQILLKLNHYSQSILSQNTEKKIIKYFQENIDNFDLLILSDFSYGVISNTLAASLISIAKEAKVFVAADSQTSSQIGNIGKFQGVDLITPTELEARLEVRNENCGLVVLAEKLMKQMQTRNIVLKLGSDGVLLYGYNTKNELIRTDQVPALNKYPVDVSGAGDSMLAAAALLLACGENLYVASYLGSIVSAIQVSRLGNIPVSTKDIEEVLN
jgi:rfaE bifunctional protein kinase chain/domain